VSFAQVVGRRRGTVVCSAACGGGEWKKVGGDGVEGHVHRRLVKKAKDLDAGAETEAPALKQRRAAWQVQESRWRSKCRSAGGAARFGSAYAIDGHR
jgi:hypothetical protein